MAQVRGAIHNLPRYKQLLSLEGLLFERGITPTDFDAVIDFGGKQWVLIEYKFKGKDLSFGQRKCLSSALEAHQKNGIQALGIVAVHTCGVSEIIDGAECEVIEVWSKGKWVKPRVSRTVKETIDFWRSF